MTINTARRDVYSRITDSIIAELEQGVRPWLKPWNAEHASGRITRPLRHNGIPYKGINVVMLWSASVTKGYGSPFWFTYAQAQELGGHVRKGEHGELVVYADRITRTELDLRGEEVERQIPFLKGYRPERTKCTKSTGKRTKVEHQAAFRRGSGAPLSGLNPSVFSDVFRAAPQI